LQVLLQLKSSRFFFNGLGCGLVHVNEVFIFLEFITLEIIVDRLLDR